MASGKKSGQVQAKPVTNQTGSGKPKKEKPEEKTELWQNGLPMEATGIRNDAKLKKVSAEIDDKDAFDTAEMEIVTAKRDSPFMTKAEVKEAFGVVPTGSYIAGVCAAHKTKIFGKALYSTASGTKKYIGEEYSCESCGITAGSIDEVVKQCRANASK